MASQSPSTRLFVQQHLSADIEDNIKAPHLWGDVSDTHTHTYIYTYIYINADTVAADAIVKGFN